MNILSLFKKKKKPTNILNYLLFVSVVGALVIIHGVLINA